MVQLADLAAFPLETGRHLRHDRHKFRRRRKGNVMNAGVLIVMVGFLAAGCMIGWHAQRVRSAHGDIKVGKNRVSGGRAQRARSGLVVTALAILALLVVSVLIRA
jgi:hypothetical protein